MTTVPAAPDPSLEASVREVWTEVLGIPDIDATTPFFEAGGNSLTAMRVVGRLHARHGTMSLRAFMSHPTIAGLARVLAGAAAPAGAAAAPAPPAAASPVSGAAARYPLSRAQRQMWEIANRLPEVGLFIVASALRVDGPLDLAVLERVFAELVTRHEALRTRFEDVGEGPVQVVEPHVEVTVEVEDHTADRDPVRSCERRMAVAGREALPLDRAPLMRVVVHRIAADRHVFFLSMHHIVCDGQSLTLLESEAIRLYREIAANGARTPRPVPLGSGRLAEQRAEWLTTGAAARQRAFWLDRLAPPFSRLADGPGSRFAELGTASFARRMRSAATSAKLSADDARTVSAAAHRHGMTDFMLVLGAYAATLRAWSGQSDIRVATNLANRAAPGMDEVVGLLTNTTVLRMSLTDTDPVAVSRQAREVCIDAFENQELPFEEVLAALQDRHPGAGAVFDAMLVAQNEIDAVTPADGLVFAPYQSDRNVLGAQVVATACDFVLTVVTVEGELRFELRYKSATTSEGLAAELLDAITTAVRATAAALIEAA
ncbi:condensation domain-containing protein [Rhizomonospora bruguierae]|uniref:condensation domain-containing protein n=1 Tax=Rhizomonospora bruguierae TaxID=1581705 RepID=UPI001BCDE338|nr:condensation domain-containing protein [Micromonospora sp. NBRC 107566]